MFGVSEHFQGNLKKPTHGSGLQSRTGLAWAWLGRHGEQLLFSWWCRELQLQMQPRESAPKLLLVPWRQPLKSEIQSPQIQDAGGEEKARQEKQDSKSQLKTLLFLVTMDDNPRSHFHPADWRGVGGGGQSGRNYFQLELFTSGRGGAWQMQNLGEDNS